MNRFFIVLLTLAGFAHGAITDYYVNVSGSGSADGSSEANAMAYSRFKDYMETGGSYTATAGDRFNLVNATYSLAATDTFVNGGTQTSPVIVRGYTTSLTDGYQGRSPENGTLVTTNMPLIAYSGTGPQLSIGTTGYLVFENLRITTQTNGIGVNANATGTSFVRCSLSNSSTDSAAAALNVTTRALVLDTDMTLTGASGGTAAAITGAAMARFIGCRFQVTSTTAWCVRLGGTPILVDSLCIGGAGVRVNDTAAVPFIYNCTITGSSGDGLSYITGIAGPQIAMNLHITDNTGGGIDNTSTGTAVWNLYNRFRDTGTAVENGNDWTTAFTFGVIDDGTTGDTSTDFVDAGAGDYRLKTTAPATSAGFPTQKSMGAYQLNQESTGGGGERSHTFVQ